MPVRLPSVSSPGTWTIGPHQASRMPSATPALAAIQIPSPVLCSRLQLAPTGPGRKFSTVSGDHSKPPQARITPDVARTVVPSSRTTPVTRPSVAVQPVGTGAGRQRDPARAHACTNAATSARPLAARAALAPLSQFVPREAGEVRHCSTSPGPHSVRAVIVDLVDLRRWCGDRGA